MNISVIGLGKLGSVMAAVFADKGNTVRGVDVNPHTVDAINAGRAPVQEPGLDELVRKNHHRLTASADCAAAVAATSITFIIVPTPSDTSGAFSLDHVLPQARIIGETLRAKKDFHVVVLSSTVMPGATGSQVRPIIEQMSGKTCGQDFGLCYNPEFIALGSVIRDMSNPDMILIGESDPRSGQMLADLYQQVCENRPPIARMNFMNAEITKLSVNTFVTTKISYANMLAELCEQLPGADVEVVTAALGLDTRIGRKYLTGALGYGGPCFPRDNIAFARLARQRGMEATLAEATDQVNRRQTPRLGELILSLLPRGGTAGILGLAYKPATSVVDESQGLAVAKYLVARGVRVAVYDPAALENARRHLSAGVTFAASLQECAAQSHVLAITTPWDEFRSLDPASLNTALGRPAIIDCWRILPRQNFEAVADYVTLGIGPRDGAGRLAAESAVV
jgi:UDPglucose 6-dehydrogenase